MLIFLIRLEIFALMGNLLIKNLVLSRKKVGSLKDKESIILKGINASFQSGQINAIMGPNGSGKTTFLSILFGHSDTDTKTSGIIEYNGEPRNIATWFREASIVEQDTFNITDQTVESMIEFVIKIKSKEFEQFSDSFEPEIKSEESKITVNTTDCKTNSLEIENREITEKVLNHTGSSLEKCKINEKQLSYKSLVTKEKLHEIYDALHLMPILQKNINNISGGERKRVMIAIELVLLKKILILDEPTSDLDSYLALKLIMYLKKIAVRDDIMVIMSIHQPSDQIYKKLDKILFLIDGRVVFFGESSNLINFLSSRNINKPADWTASDFIFEAFYNKSVFKEFQDLNTQVTALLADITAESNLIVSSSSLSNKGKKSILDFNLNALQSFVLFDRAVMSLLKTKSFYLNVFCTVCIISFMLFFTCKSILDTNLSSYRHVPIKLFPISFNPEIRIKDLLFNENLIKNDDKESTELIYKQIYKDFVKSTVSYYFLEEFLLLSNFIIGFTSGIFSMKDQLLNEISKGLYSSITLFVASLALEHLLFIAIGFILAVISIFIGFHYLFSFTDWFFVSIYFSFLSLTSHLINTIFLHPVSSIYVVRSILYFLKTVGSSTTFYIVFYELLKNKLKFAATALRYVLCLIILTVFPSHSLFYLICYSKICNAKMNLQKYVAPLRELKPFDLFEGYEHTNNYYFLRIFNDNAIDYKWMFLVLLGSTLMATSLAIFTFSKVFNPRIAIQI